MVRLKVAVEIEGAGVGARVDESAAEGIFVRRDQFVFVQRNATPRAQAGSIHGMSEGAAMGLCSPFPAANPEGMERVSGHE